MKKLHFLLYLIEIHAVFATNKLSNGFYPLNLTSLDIYRNKYHSINVNNWPILNYLSAQVSHNEHQTRLRKERDFLKIKLNKNFKYVLRFIHNCLNDPKCSFINLRRYLEFACIFARKYKMNSSKNSFVEFQRYCDIIRSISLLEYCLLNFLIDTQICNVASIKNVITFYSKKCNTIDYSLLPDFIRVNYCKLFTERSIEFLIEIIAIFNQDDIYSLSGEYKNIKYSNQMYYSDVYELLLNLLKSNVEKFLSKTNPDYNNYRYIKILLNKKLSNLMENTRMKIFNQVRSMNKDLDLLF